MMRSLINADLDKKCREKHLDYMAGCLFLYIIMPLIIPAFLSFLFSPLAIYLIFLAYKFSTYADLPLSLVLGSAYVMVSSFFSIGLYWSYKDDSNGCSFLVPRS